MRVALVRHPRAAVAAGICYGRTDWPLHEDGGVALREIGARLAGFGAARVWTSPARRCRDVADALSALTPALSRQMLEARGAGEGRGESGAPIVDPRLQELDFGAWEGVPWNDVPRAELDRWAADPLAFAPPGGGESGVALVARVWDFAAGLGGGDAVIVSHGGPLKVLAALLHGRKVDLLAPAPALGSVEIIQC